MKDLGTNTVRVYTVDPTADHDGCMQAFASQGIYVRSLTTLSAMYSFVPVHDNSLAPRSG